MPNASKMGVPPEIIAQWKEDFRQKKAKQAKSGSKRLPPGSVQYEYNGVVYTGKFSGNRSVAFPQASYEAKVEGARSRKGEQQKIKLSSIEQQLVDQKYEDARMLSKYLDQKVVVDHIIPINKGGFANDPNNLQLITENTNLRKSSSMEWYNASQDESKYLSNLANELAGDINYSRGTATLRRSAMGLAAGARRAAGVLPFAGAIAGGLAAGGQAMAGDIEGAKVTAFETAAGEVPVVGDIFTADPAASGTLEGAQQTAMEVRRQEQQPKSAAAKILDDPLNELKYAGKQILGGLKTVGGAILFGF